MARRDSLEAIFEIRCRVARIGSSDRLAWWDSEALTPAGLYALERLFRRTAHLTAADLAMRAARLRHDRAVPQEPLVHLFNFGEAFEGSFERWLIDRKAESWKPPALTDEREEVGEHSAATALTDLNLDVTGVGELPNERNGCVVLGSILPTEVEAEGTLFEVARRLAAAYVAAIPEHLVVPYFRLAR